MKISSSTRTGAGHRGDDQKLVESVCSGVRFAPCPSAQHSGCDFKRVGEEPLPFQSQALSTALQISLDPEAVTWPPNHASGTTRAICVQSGTEASASSAHTYFMHMLRDWHLPTHTSTYATDEFRGQTSLNAVCQPGRSPLKILPPSRGRVAGCLPALSSQGEDLSGIDHRAARPLRGRLWHLPPLHGQCAACSLHVAPGATAVAKSSGV